MSGLHWACINNRLSTVSYLIKAGADVNFRGGDLKATPLHWASKSGLVYIVDELLKEGADPTITDSQGYNLLHTSVFSSNIMLVIYVLFFVIDGKYDVDEKDPHSRTALQWATYQADALTVENLLKFNASVKTVDDAGFTALHWATVKGSVPVMELLIKYGSDFFQTTNEGKNCFTIGKELYSISSLETALASSGFDKSGFPATKYMEASTGKLLTFLFPWILLPVFLFIFGNVTFIIAVLFNSIIFLSSAYALSKFIIPSYLQSSRHTFLRSPLLSGILSGTIALTFVCWISKVLYYTFSKRPILNFLMAALFAGLGSLFVFLVKSDPGYIPGTSDHDEVRSTIRELLTLGKFDAKNFCVHTWVRIPLRSKYDRDSKCLISRFDHFCPWIYNQVGLLNHKAFLLFILVLELAVWAFIPLAIEYFDELEDYVKGHASAKCRFLSEDLCFGWNNAPFIFALLVWVTAQSVWVFFLLGVQFIQTSKGITDYEFSQLKRRFKSTNTTTDEYFSSTPIELMNDDVIAGLETPIIDPRGTPPRTCCRAGCSLLGLDKVASMIKSILHLNSQEGSYHRNALLRIPTDYGWKQNLRDFWLTADVSSPTWRRILYPPKDSHALLNGYDVDYYTLYKLPTDMDTVV